jgi:transcriptional regulator with XRE-family HTH domain
VQNRHQEDDMSPQEALPAHIRRLRERHGWSQSDLTERMNRLGAGLDRSQVARVENGTRDVKLDELIVYALALNTSLVSLLLPSAWEGDVELTPRVPPPPRTRAERDRERERDWPHGKESVYADIKEARAWARGETPLWPTQDPLLWAKYGPPSEDA